MSDEIPEVDAVLAAASAAWRALSRSPPPDAAEGAPFLCDCIASARRAWPEIALPRDVFIAAVVRGLPPDRALVDALGELRAADLWLACACARADRSALASFEATFGGELAVALRRRQSTFDLDEFRQHCHAKLFAPPSPKIAEYSGRGDLRHWLRVTYVRALIDLARKSPRREVPVAAEALLRVPEPAGDPELLHLKARYRGEFRAAFEAAAHALSSEDRNLLRRHYTEGLGIDELAALDAVHRATAARRLASAREALLSGTRQRLMAKLRLDRAALDSVMRLIESNVHLSLGRVLGPGSGTRAG